MPRVHKLVCMRARCSQQVVCFSASLSLLRLPLCTQLYGLIKAPWFLAFFVAGLSSFNAIYYGFQSISALTRNNIVTQYEKEGPKIFEHGGRGIKVDRPGS
jgi:hypothetical protein